MVPEHKKPAHLQEVEDDAVRITQKRFRDQEEERQYKAEKTESVKLSAPVVESPVQAPVEPQAVETKPESPSKKGQ